MSYDYNALVSAIAAARRQAASLTASREDRLAQLQLATEHFDKLSSHCSMTPLLWIQYARTAFDLVIVATSPPPPPGMDGGADNHHASSKQEDSEASLRAAADIRLQTVELGLQEFPGSCLLQVYYVHHVMRASHIGWDQKKSAIDNAIHAVGRGSHRNEGCWVALLYTLQAQLLLLRAASDTTVTSKDQDKAQVQAEVHESFVQRSRVPMKDANDSITADYREFCQQHDYLTASPDVLQAIEHGRRLESKVFSAFVSLEDEIDAVMSRDGILLARDDVIPTTAGLIPEVSIAPYPEEWEEQLEQLSDQGFAMGLGGPATAAAFIKYALAFQKHSGKQKKRRARNGQEDDVDPEQVQLESGFESLALAVYERGIAECPTVETIWLSYIRCIHEFLQGTSHPSSDLEENALAQRLQLVVSRAVRNCPYSQSLVEQQLHAAFVLAQRGLLVLDPDQLLSTVQSALENKFLPGEACFLALYTQAIRIVKRRILHLLSPTKGPQRGKTILFDEPEHLNTKENRSTLTEDERQEITDLIEEMPDLFDNVEARLQKAFPSWTEGRAQLWRERAYTETLLLKPLEVLLEDDAPQVSEKQSGKESIAVFERCTRVHNPPHPDTCLAYIRQFINSEPVGDPCAVSAKLRHVRFLYQNAINSVGRSKSSRGTVRLNSFDVALSNLGQEWIEFESFFGSDRSLGRAEKAIQRKVQKTTEHKDTADVFAEDSSSNKRKLESDNDTAAMKTNQNDHPPKKKRTENPTAEMDHDQQAQPEQESRITKPEKPTGEKTKAHPFTVRVSNLALETEDMDLVDTFRSKCGKVVHAKIVREKSQHGKGLSRGWGLVQFEEREAAEKALTLNGVIGLKEKLVTVEPSHMPAAPLVPPGMHRINPKGEGRSSKRNQKKREQRADDSKGKPKDVVQDKGNEESEAKSAAAAAAETGVTEADKKKASRKAGASDVLSFRPRGVVTHGPGHRKIHLEIKDKTK